MKNNSKKSHKYSFHIFYDTDGNINLEVDVPSGDILSELITAALTIKGIPDMQKLQNAVHEGTFNAIQNTPRTGKLGELKGYRVSLTNALKMHGTGRKE